MRWFLLAALLHGCAGAEYWVRTWEGAAQEPRVVVVDRVPTAYAELGGWTVCDKAARRCTIYVSARADRACVEAHERRHAAGFDHPDYAQSFACVQWINVPGFSARPYF